MAIYNIFDYCDKQSAKRGAGYQDDLFAEVELAQAKVLSDKELEGSKKDRFFSSLAARLFFALLLVADVFWGLYHIFILLALLALHGVTGCQLSLIRRGLSRSFLSVKRAFVCGLSLFVAIVSPALGIMFACTYFLMYDKDGIEEVVPASLQHQFKAFFQPE